MCSAPYLRAMCFLVLLQMSGGSGRYKKRRSVTGLAESASRELLGDPKPGSEPRLTRSEIVAAWIWTRECTEQTHRELHRLVNAARSVPVIVT